MCIRDSPSSGYGSHSTPAEPQSGYGGHSTPKQPHSAYSPTEKPPPQSGYAGSSTPKTLIIHPEPHSGYGYGYSTVKPESGYGSGPHSTPKPPEVATGEPLPAAVLTSSLPPHSSKPGKNPGYGSPQSGYGLAQSSYGESPQKSNTIPDRFYKTLPSMLGHGGPWYQPCLLYTSPSPRD